MKKSYINTIKDIIVSQQDFFNTNKSKDVDFRIEQLKKLKSIIQENEHILYDAIYKDFGKSEFETYATELSLLYHEINFFLKNIRNWSKKQKVASGLANFPSRSYVIFEPLGVSLIIGAWNYPYQLSLLPALSSLAAGNTVLLKPSELPNNTSKVIAKLINENFSSEYFHVIEGGVEVTNELLEHRFDKIFFTGSSQVGRIIYQAAAKHLTPVTLELGGKSPCFVLADTNLKLSAKRIVWSKFLNAGQTCVAPDYILVEQSIESKLLEALKHEVEQFYSMNTEELQENYLQIINQKNFDRLKVLLDRDKLYFGGHTNEEKRFIAPSIMSNISFDDAIMQDEIFGPILPVISFENLDDAIAKVKHQPKPLSCYVYSTNRRRIDKILYELSFGGGAVNDSVMHLSNSNLPFGGVGHSGMGSYHGKWGFDNFSHKKGILEKSFWFEPSIKYSPYTNFKKNIIKLLMG